MNTNTLRSIREQALYGAGCLVLLGAMGLVTGLIPNPLDEKAAAPVRTALEWKAGGEVSDGPLFEVRNIRDVGTIGGAPVQYDFAPVRFEEHRGRWLLLTFISGSDDTHVGGTAYGRNAAYFSALYEETKDLEPLEVWAVRGHRSYMRNSPMLDNSIDKCVPGFLPNGVRYDQLTCFDRFIYGAYHRGDDRLWITPLRDWARAMAKRAGADVSALIGAPQVWLIDPSGRLYLLPGTVATDNPVRYSGAKAIAAAVRSLVAGGAPVVAENGSVQIAGDVLPKAFNFEALKGDVEDARLADFVNGTLDDVTKQIKRNATTGAPRSNMPWGNAAAEALENAAARGVRGAPAAAAKVEEKMEEVSAEASR